MVISSRTPEGDPNRCPVCGHRCRVEPSLPSRDGPCPRCGHLLWFGDPADSGSPSARSEILQAIRLCIEARFGPPPPELESAVAALTERVDLKQVLERVAMAPSLAELLASD